MYVCVYTYIHIYTHTYIHMLSHRWSRNPRPQPQTFSKLALLIYFGESYIFLNWLSGALVGVGDSDFIGYSLVLTSG